MIEFKITVDGEEYFGLFASSVDAVIDAAERFPGARRISVKPC